MSQSKSCFYIGCETTIRKSPDCRRLTAGSRADSENEVLLLAPKPSDVRRHSDGKLKTFNIIIHKCGVHVSI